MEIRVLRYFLAVAREGNIAGAAAFLHLTQPTLSRQIRDLEEELGHALLVRKSHGVALTAEGMLFRRRAEEILSMVDRTEAEFASMGEAVRGDIYIGGGETQAVRLIADIAREVRARHPGVRYHLFSGNAEDVTERLDKGLLDFGILIQPADISKYDYLNLPCLLYTSLCPLLLPQEVSSEDHRPPPFVSPPPYFAWRGMLRPWQFCHPRCG